MGYKIGTYRKYLCIGLLCLLIFGGTQVGYAELKIYYRQIGQFFWEDTLWRLDANGENKELFLEPPVPMFSPQLSPDGQHILFSTHPIKAGGVFESKLMVMNFDGSNLRELLADPPRPAILGGKWSPDGKWIVYFAFDPNQHPPKYEVFVTDAQGFNSFQIAADLEERIVRFNWFPDSRRLALSIAKPLRNGKLHWVDAAPNAKPKEMAIELFAETIRWSPNGERTILFGAIRDVRNRQDLFLGDALGKNLILLTGAAQNPSGGQWLPDSKHIVYTPNFERPDVGVMNVDTKAVQRLTDNGRSQFVFWHDPTLAVEAAGKLSTSWGAIKAQVTAAKK